MGMLINAKLGRSNLISMTSYYNDIYNYGKYLYGVQQEAIKNYTDYYNNTSYNFLLTCPFVCGWRYSVNNTLLHGYYAPSDNDGTHWFEHYLYNKQTMDTTTNALYATTHTFGRQTDHLTFKYIPAIEYKCIRNSDISSNYRDWEPLLFTDIMFVPSTSYHLENSNLGEWRTDQSFAEPRPLYTSEWCYVAILSYKMEIYMTDKSTTNYFPYQDLLIYQKYGFAIGMSNEEISQCYRNNITSYEDEDYAHMSGIAPTDFDFYNKSIPHSSKVAYRIDITTVYMQFGDNINGNLNVRTFTSTTSKTFSFTNINHIETFSFDNTPYQNSSTRTYYFSFGIHLGSSRVAKLIIKCKYSGAKISSFLKNTAGHIQYRIPRLTLSPHLDSTIVVDLRNFNTSGSGYMSDWISLYLDTIYYFRGAEVSYHSLNQTINISPSNLPQTIKLWDVPWQEQSVYLNIKNG